MSDFRDCSKKEMIAFIKDYPRQLERDVAGMFEPPLVTFNDFTLGNWPESVVAKYHLEIRADNAPGWGCDEGGYQIRQIGIGADG